MPNSPAFFTSHGPISDPGPRASLLDDLPGDIASLVEVVQGLMIHVFWADQYGVALDEARAAEVQLRALGKQLARIVELDARPLAVPREPAARLAGNCRDFATLLTAILRHQGVPARARCGFGRYFLPDHYEDHWVAEYWDAAQARWVFVDAQLDALQRDKLAVSFDPLDVPRDQFVTGGRAWAMCRAGEVAPERFGIHDLHGLWFIRGDLVRDVAALNKMEMLPWDSWGIADRSDEALTADDMAALDEMAALSGGDVAALAEVRSRYESDSRWRVPPIITSYTAAGPQAVELFPPTPNYSVT